VKTLGEIAIEAGLVNKVTAAKAGRMAEGRKERLVVVLVRELGVNEVALVAALRKQTRVPLIDPGSIEIDPEALRQVPRDICARLRLLPLSLTTDRRGKLLRIAMADPTDTQAVAEIEQLTHCDVEVNVLPLSAIDELVDKGYRQINTAVVSRAGNPGATMFVTSRGKVEAEAESEVSETAQIPLATLQAMGPDDLEARFAALVGLLLAKGLVTEAELAEALRKGKA
jgi:type II secretion system (T2SS) protein E